MRETTNTIAAFTGTLVKPVLTAACYNSMITNFLTRSFSAANVGLIKAAGIPLSLCGAANRRSEWYLRIYSDNKWEELGTLVSS
ncbi:MAG: hypothetical protein H0X66_01545 [Verrucomicrobia bacterium]|nr:hypothetical protein [Verrucomicrobiota bacterium]